MKLQDFYTLLDSELEEIIHNNPQDKRLHQNKQGDKAYAFLIWFLQFYGLRPIYNQYITEGDDDTSCDIIFSNTDLQGRKIFYIVQSKWNSIKNANGQFAGEPFRATLSDFQRILLGQKEVTRNLNFNRKYGELKTHIEANGEVKFIYLTLAHDNHSVNEAKEAFEKHNNCDVEIIDIERLRRDFIEVRYKQIKPTNPLEYDYNPEIDPIVLSIEQLDINRNYLEVKAPFESFIFFVRPKTIHDLFEKYGFKMFALNVRNPLIVSEYNKQIEESLKNSPSYFWYFNNGITAITKILPNKINDISKRVEIQGLQIINGAQTVYSIYKAYKDAKNGNKSIMNGSALVTFRLIRGGNRDFELDVTRYTNQQNKIEPRDFWANEPNQVRLQNESFQSPYWYEIRRGEFRLRPKTITGVENIEFAKSYLAIFLQKPYLVDENLIFVFPKEDKKGLYEIIFNEETHFEDMLAVYKLKIEMAALLNLKTPKFYLSLGLFKTVFDRLKPSETPFANEINRLLATEHGIAFLLKIQIYILLKLKEMDKNVPKSGLKNVFALFVDSAKFNHRKTYFEVIDIEKRDIEKIDIDSAVKELSGV